MTKMLEPMLQEFQQEAATTRRVLERVPAGKLTWRPHSKSMSLGQLSMHVRKFPGGISKLAQVDDSTSPRRTSARPSPKMCRRFCRAQDESVKSRRSTMSAG